MDQLEQNYDAWAKCWMDQKFPAGIHFKTYSSWRRVLDYWNDNKDLHDLPLRLVVQIYVRKVKGGLWGRLF